jgi:uncharacterized protein
METLKPRIEIDREKLETFCKKWKITELALFGSVLRDDFGPDSDVDVLVTFAPDSHWTIFDFIHCEDEIKRLVGRDVDLVERSAVSRSKNYIRRKAILTSTRTIYAA